MSIFNFLFLLAEVEMIPPTCKNEVASRKLLISEKSGLILFFTANWDILTPWFTCCMQPISPISSLFLQPRLISMLMNDVHLYLTCLSLWLVCPDAENCDKTPDFFLNCLRLNPVKTEFIWLGTKQIIERIDREAIAAALFRKHKLSGTMNCFYVRNYPGGACWFLWQGLLVPASSDKIHICKIYL